MENERPDPLQPPEGYAAPRPQDIPIMQNHGDTAPCQCQGCCQPCPNQATEEDLNCNECRQRQNRCTGEHSEEYSFGLGATDFRERLQEAVRSMEGDLSTMRLSGVPDISTMANDNLHWEWKTYDGPFRYEFGGYERPPEGEGYVSSLPREIPGSLPPTSEHLRQVTEYAKKQLKEAYGIDPDKLGGTSE